VNVVLGLGRVGGKGLHVDMTTYFSSSICDMDMCNVWSVCYIFVYSWSNKQRGKGEILVMLLLFDDAVISLICKYIC